MLRISGKRLKNIFKWEKFVPTKIWVEKNIYLTAEVSPIVGYMQLKYMPHLEDILDDFDRPHIWKQTLMFSSQCAKTTVIFSCACKSLDTDPTMMQLTIPADNGVGDYLTGKLNPFIKGIKSLRKKVDDFKESEKIRNVSARKRVAGGILYVTGCGEKERRSRTVKYLFLDEVSLFPNGAVNELIGRTKAFEKFFRKIILVSTLKSKGDEIETSYDSADWKREWQLKCRNCNQYFYPESKHFKFLTEKDYREQNNIDDESFKYHKYKNTALKDVYLECPNCEHHINSKEKDEMILNKECMFITAEGNKKKTTVGYKANALAMYMTNFETIAGLLIDAKDSYERKSIIYVDYFNEIYNPEVKKVSKISDFLLLSNGLRTWEVPEDTVKLYMGIDTQKDHFYWEIRAYCYGFVSHTVAYGRAEHQSQLKDIMFMNFFDKNGKRFNINRVGIDRRGIVERTIIVDDFIIEILEETGEQDFIYATEGVAKINGEIMYKVKRLKKELDGTEYEFKILTINNLMAKNELNNCIQRTINKIKDDKVDYTRRLFYINQDVCDKALDRNERAEKSIATDYERMYTAEVFNERENIWEKRNNNVRNDYWDCGVITIAMAELDLVGNLQKPKESSDDGSILLNLF